MSRKSPLRDAKYKAKRRNSFRSLRLRGSLIWVSLVLADTVFMMGSKLLLTGWMICFHMKLLRLLLLRFETKEINRHTKKCPVQQFLLSYFLCSTHCFESLSKVWILLIKNHQYTTVFNYTFPLFNLQFQDKPMTK